MKILIAYGTRPEWIKFKPIIDALDATDIEYKLLFTGQHASADMNKDFRWDHRRVIPDRFRTTDRLSWVVSHVIDTALPECTHVMVLGDTTSAFTIALQAFHERKPVIHIEAGLRTKDPDNPFPEEVYRQLISKLATYHFCPTAWNSDNIIVGEQCNREHVYVVGNTVLDPLLGTPVTYENEVLVTLHRRENHDILDEWYHELEELAAVYKDVTFSFIRHPNPAVSKHLDVFKNVDVVDPMSHEDLIAKLAKCKVVITDSGGLQEEACFLQKRIIVCRKITERPESLGTHAELCDEPNHLPCLFAKAYENYSPPEESCPYGDGKSAPRIVRKIANIS